MNWIYFLKKNQFKFKGFENEVNEINNAYHNAYPPIESKTILKAHLNWDTDILRQTINEQTNPDANLK